jgi:hypothetical protein
VPKQQLNDIRQRVIRRQHSQSSSSPRRDRTVNEKSILKKLLYLLILSLSLIIIIPTLSYFLNRLSSSIIVTPVGNTFMLIAAVIAAVFVIGVIAVFFMWLWDQDTIKKIMSKDPARPHSLRTTYRPSPLLHTSNGSSALRIRIVEEPLTAQNFSIIISALTELHTKCLLIAKGRFPDLIEYSQTRNIRFPEQARLIISKITQNSPVDIKFNVNADASAQGIVEALKLGIDAVSQAPLRHKEIQLANQAKELELKIQELVAQSELDDKAQTRQINAQRAELENQKTQLELERQRLEIDRQNVALQKERLEYQIAARDFAFDTAGMMIEKLYPEADKSTKAILIRTLIPDLLQLGNGKGLELALPVAEDDDKKIDKGTVTS